MVIRRPTLLLFCLALAMAPPALAEGDGIAFNSVRVVRPSADSYFVDVDIDNDGSMGPIMVGGSARSRDGRVVSRGFMPAGVQIGQHVHSVFGVVRPWGSHRLKTDTVRVMAYLGGQSGFVFKTFELPYIWDAVPLAQSAPGRTPTESKENQFAFGDDFFVLFNSQDYALLDTLFDSVSATQERDYRGLSATYWFKAMMEYEFRSPAWKERAEQLRMWRAANPESAAEAIAEAVYWRAYSWSLRGAPEHPDTDPEILRTVRTRLERAAKSLSDSEKYAARSPLWYQLRVAIASDQGADEPTIAALFADGVKHYPRDYDLYSEMVAHWTRWYTNQDWRKADEVVALGVKNTQSTDGNSLYAQVYKGAEAQQRHEFNLLNDSLVTWPKLKTGFDDLLQRFPDVSILNSYASYACRANDRETFLRVMGAIGSGIDPALWRSGYSPDLCARHFATLN
jgi:hypothetical protein